MNSKGGVVNLSILLVSFNKFIKESMSKPFFFAPVTQQMDTAMRKEFSHDGVESCENFLFHMTLYL